MGKKGGKFLRHVVIIAKSEMRMEENILEVECNENWWPLRDLNPRPFGCKPSALPTELSGQDN